MKKTQTYRVMVVGYKEVYAHTPEEAERLAETNGFTAIHADPVSLLGKRYNSDSAYGYFKHMAHWLVDYVSSLSDQRRNYKKNSKHWNTFPDRALGCVARPSVLDELMYK
jgi:hypothetical protein